MNDTDHMRLLGVCAFVLLTTSVASGQILSGRLAPVGRRSGLFRLHRMASVSGLVVAAVHGLGSAEAASGSQAALGLVALAGMATPAAAWAARRSLATRWRLIHAAAYVAFATATIHVVAFHPPTMPRAEALLYTLSVAGVGGLVVWRAGTAAMHITRRPPAARSGS